MEFMIENKYVIKCNVLLGDNVYHLKTHKGGNLQCLVQLEMHLPVGPHRTELKQDPHSGQSNMALVL